MKIQIKRRSICFTPKTESLLKKLREKTELNYSNIVKEAIELLAEKKGVHND